MRSLLGLGYGFAVAAAAAVMLTVATEQPLHGQSAKPNIVVFMIDDLDMPTMQVLLSKGLMPNLKSYFVDVGVAFPQTFAVAGLGGPSRATFLTGQYPHNHGMLGNYLPLGGITKLNQFSTVATWLNNAGYYTSLVGRHVTGYGWWTDPRAVPPGWNDWNALIEPGAFSMRNYSMNLNRTIVDFGAFATATGLDLYQTDVLGSLAGTAVRRAAAQPDPMFLLVTPVIWNREILPVYNVCADPSDTGPFGGNFWGVSEQPATRHLNTVFGDSLNFPLPQPPSFDEADVEDKPDWLKANPRLTAEDVDCLTKRYWRKLEAFRAVDDMVGNVMSELQATGKLGNTIAIFTGDNGLVDGQHRFPEKTPAYEEAIRVPLWVRLPGATVPRTSSRMVLNTDLAPTIAQLGQATMTHAVDGRSIVPLLQNTEYLPWRAVGMVELKLEGSQSIAGFTGPPDYFALRTSATRPRLYVQYPTVTTGIVGELYDLEADPYQLQNLYTDPLRQSEKDRLESWVNAMKTCRGLGCYILENLFTFN
jgi:N-acetylglucosamine-6-sulfatase